MNSIICIGDSLTYGYGVNPKFLWVNLLRDEFENINFINEGKNGDTTIGMLNRFTEAVVYKNASKVIIFGGTNNFLTNKTVESTIRNIKLMVKEAMENNIDPIIVAPPKIKPQLAINLWDSYCDYDKVNQLIDEYAEKLQEFCNKENITFINLNKTFDNIKENKFLYTDGIHLTKEGNEVVFKEVYKCLL